MWNCMSLKARSGSAAAIASYQEGERGEVNAGGSMKAGNCSLSKPLCAGSRGDSGKR